MAVNKAKGILGTICVNLLCQDALKPNAIHSYILLPFIHSLNHSCKSTTLIKAK